MVGITMVPPNTFTETSKEARLADIQKLCTQKVSFDEVYSGLNEKYINEIIDQESMK
jgi:hypothetical protein